MPAAAPADLFAFLERLGIATETFEHAPVFTVAESRSIKAAIRGGHSKNLFLKDRKKPSAPRGGCPSARRSFCAKPSASSRAR